MHTQNMGINKINVTKYVFSGNNLDILQNFAEPPFMLHLKILEYNLIDVNWKPGLKSDDNNQKAVIPSGRGVKRGEKPNNKRQHQRR